MRTPKVPEPTTQRQVEPGILQAHVSDATPGGAAAFGGVSPALERAGVSVISDAQKIQNATDTMALNGGKNAILSLAAGFMPTVTTAQGSNALKYSPTLENGEFNDFRSQLKGVVDNFKGPDAVREKLNEFKDHMLAGYTKQAQTHVLREVATSDLKNIDANIKNLTANGVMARNDPATVDYLHQQILEQVAQRTGHRGEDFAAQSQGFTDTYYGAILQSYRDNNQVAAGEAMLKSLKDRNIITGKQVNAQQAWFDKKKDELDGKAFFDNNKFRYQDANGYVNRDAMYRTIDAAKDLTFEQKQTYKQMVDLSYRKDKSVVDQQTADAMAQFSNFAAPKNGPPPSADKIIQKANDLGRNGLRRKAMIKWAMPEHPELKIILGGSKSAKDFASIHHTIYEGIMEGRLTQADLDKLYTAKDAQGNDISPLSKNEFNIAQNLLDGINKRGVDKFRTQFSQIARREIDDAFGRDNVEGQNMFGEFVKYMSGNPDAGPKELRQWLSDNLTPSIKDPKTFWSKLSAEETEGDGAAVRSLRAQMGAETLDKVMDSLTTKENPHPGVADLQKFIQEGLGVGIEDVGVGTPINNAMSSIIEWNKNHPDQQHPLTPGLILWAAKNLPFGYSR